MKADLPKIRPGVNLCCQVEPTVTDDFLTFMNQIGVDHAYAWFTPEQYNYDFLSHFKERLNKKNITLYNVGAVHIAKSRKIILNKPGRDEDIQMFIDSLEMLSKVGIHTTTFTWEPDGVWASDWEYPTRGGAITRACDMSVLLNGPRKPDKRYTQIPIDGQAFAQTGLSHGRVYTLEEMWENYEYFIRRIIPAAEQFGVRLALHPNDPPVDSVGGVACLIKNYDDYRRAFSIVESDFLGMEFCCGCWWEAADTFGDIYQAIDEFVKRKKIFLVHFRNVDKLLPNFVEVFIDEGYGDMLSVIQSLIRSGYTGTLVMDHSPEMVSGNYGEAGFAYGYIKALFRCAQQKQPHL